MKKIFFIVITGLQLAASSGQSVVKNEANVLSGSLNLDSRIAFNNSEKIITPVLSNIEDQKKSVWLAVGLSAVLPGAGEFYSGSYIKSAAFIAVEAAAITLGLIYNKKGNDQTNYFQNYADASTGWSPLRYAQWTLVHIKELNPNLNASDYENKVIQNGQVNWNEMHALEIAVAGRNGMDGQVPGSYYSHQLPTYRSQQYYELIGKYPQFAVGWYEFSGTDLNKPFIYGDPLPKQFLDYSVMRGKANDFYDVAAKAVLVVVVNHIVSAIDAAWTTHNFNKNLDLHASIETRDYGFISVYYTQLNLQYRF